MSHNRSILFWICILAVNLLTSGQVLRADDPSAATGNDKVVPVNTGNTVTPVKVHEVDPYKNLHVPAPTDKYDPTKYSMNQTSSMANKSFSSDSIALSKKDSSLVHDQNAFAMKPYGGTNPSNVGNTHFSTSTSADYNRNDSQDVKNYATSSSATEANRFAAFASTSPDQNRTATFGGEKTDVYSSGLSKQYTGPGAQKVPDGSVKENVVMAHVSDIPNHPLSIDEVRNLINHGVKPDSDNKPAEPSKALNDPDYKPEVSPDPPEAPAPPRASAVDDDKSDPLPSPGTMAQPPPENTDPLPQH